MSEFVFRPAERKRVSAKVALVGASGSGKTWSSLLFMRGLVGPHGMIAGIDTENDSMAMYEGLIATEKQPKGFDVLNLTPPFTVERYLKAIEAAEKQQYDGLVIDQASWLWDGPGGLLQMHAQLAKSKKGGEWSAWNDIGELYQSFIQKILLSDLHIVITLRAKAVYGDEEDDRGKRKKVKIGTAPIQRPGFEYELQIVFDLDQANNAAVSKDRTGLFRDHRLPMALTDGEKLREFLDSGRPMDPEEKRAVAGLPRPKAAAGAATTGAAPEQASPVEVAGEAVLDMKQRKQLFRAAESLKIPHERIAELMREAGGTDKSDQFPVAKLDALMKRFAEQSAPKPERPEEPLLTPTHRKLVEATLANIGMSADEAREVFKKVAGVERLDRVPDSTFGALMDALLAADEPESEAEKREPAEAPVAR